MKKFKYNDLILIGIAFFAVIIIIYRLLGEDIQHYFQQHDIKRIKAVVISEKNYKGNQHVAFEYSYSYMFIVNGKQYVNDSHDYTLKIGDSIEIEYDRNWPRYNRPLPIKKE